MERINGGIEYSLGRYDRIGRGETEKAVGDAGAGEEGTGKDGNGDAESREGTTDEEDGLGFVRVADTITLK